MLSCVLLFSFLVIYSRLKATNSTISDTFFFFFTVCGKDFFKESSPFIYATRKVARFQKSSAVNMLNFRKKAIHNSSGIKLQLELPTHIQSMGSRELSSSTLLTDLQQRWWENLQQSFIRWTHMFLTHLDIIFLGGGS